MVICRKQGGAENLTVEAGLDKPGPDQFNKMFSLYRELCDLLGPKRFEKLIAIAAEDKELKDEAGAEL